MGKRTCRLCGRRFVSGLALAGHMRSHAMIKPPPPPPEASRSADPDSSLVIDHCDSDAESFIAPPPDHADTSYGADEVEVARCLVMLSRDAWAAAAAEDHQDRARGVRPHRRYQCASCKRVFRSYHALGGHRAGHKKLGQSCKMALGTAGGATADHVHECPFCFRVFSSGQALGGHKKSHIYGAGSSPALRASSIYPPAAAGRRLSMRPVIDLDDEQV